MSLNYDFSKVKDHEKLHEDKNEWQLTDTLIWMTMAVGIREIKESNYVEFYARLHFLEKLEGAFINADGKPRYYTVEDVKRRIGLYTNVTDYTRTKFIAMKSKRFFEDIERHEAQKVEE